MTKNQLLEFVAKTLRMEGFSEETNFGESEEWDSLSHLLLIRELEKQLSVKIAPTKIARLMSGRDLINYFFEIGVIKDAR